MARYDHLPIWKDAVALATLLEEAVRRFPRYHKYALGTDLRRQAYAVCRGVVVANGEREGRARAVERLAVTVEELKLLVQMGKEVKAFASFKEFERAAELAVALSKQSGGWRRSLTGDEAGTSPGDGLKVRPEGRRREPKSLCAPVAQPIGLVAGRRVGQKHARRPAERMSGGWGGLP